MFEKIFGYGVNIRNLKGCDENFLASQELEYIGFSKSDSIIDVVRSDDPNRPKLQELIDSLSDKDRIDLYSIDTLLQGNSNKGVEYYSKIINKGIALLIFDFSGSVYKISKFSNLKMDGKGNLIYKDISKDDLIESFKEYAISKEKVSKSGYLKRKRGVISEAFKEIYFAYESYQIDLPTTLTLAKDYCNICHKSTFWALAADYERSTEYAFDLEIYANPDNGILELPKRSGGVPDEYFQVKNKMLDVDPKLNFVDKFAYATQELGFYLSYQVYHRWDLAFEKKPKPRKPVGTTFRISEFKETYTKYDN